MTIWFSLSALFSPASFLPAILLLSSDTRRRGSADHHGEVAATLAFSSAFCLEDFILDFKVNDSSESSSARAVERAPLIAGIVGASSIVPPHPVPGAVERAPNPIGRARPGSSPPRAADQSPPPHPRSRPPGAVKRAPPPQTDSSPPRAVNEREQTTDLCRRESTRVPRERTSLCRGLLPPLDPRSSTRCCCSSSTCAPRWRWPCTRALQTHSSSYKANRASRER
jgi:hypothetical protein